jgi:NAD(P)-dependent dehydrogenase (short-subunit alcohol dehydrogenase family)
MSRHTLAARVVAITGASAGIGRACAERCAAAGMAVVLFARREAQLADAARTIVDRGGRAAAVTGDVTREADVGTLVETALARFGRLDVMICNAGIGFHGTLDATSPDVFGRLFDVNVTGTFLAARAAMPVFRRQGAGHLIVVSSIVGRRGMAHAPAYSATKFAQVGLAESIRGEFAGSGVHVSTVFPVSTLTEFHDAMGRDFGIEPRRRGPQQPADAVATAIVSCIRRPRPEVYPYPPSRALFLLNALAPRLCDRLLAWYVR